MEHARLLQTIRALAMGRCVADGVGWRLGCARQEISQMKKVLIPLVLFIGLVGFLAVGLKRDPREIPSPLINKPAPEFSLFTLAGDAKFSPADM
jgi:hypothetical protein